MPIEDSILGNSPEDYSPELVGGKTVIFTTTNGTQALLHAKKAKQIYLGAFVNASAVVQKLLGQEAGSSALCRHRWPTHRRRYPICRHVGRKTPAPGGWAIQSERSSHCRPRLMAAYFRDYQSVGNRTAKTRAIGENFADKALAAKTLWSWDWNATYSPPPKSTGLQLCRNSIRKHPGFKL